MLCSLLDLAKVPAAAFICISTFSNFLINFGQLSRSVANNGSAGAKASKRPAYCNV